VISIGELSKRTGVAITALRYYDELGLVRPAARASGQRRYDDGAVSRVGAVLFLRDVGLSLDEIGQFMRGDDWRAIVERKIVELDEQTANLRAGRVALLHALHCPVGEPANCPKFWSIIERRLARRRGPVPSGRVRDPMPRSHS
jgi:DNA-binding transcriptional MerR regulator